MTTVSHRQEPIETERLILRRFEDDDLDSLYEIQSNREAMKFTYCPSTRAESAENLRAYAALEDTHGFAPWTVVHGPDRRIIGWGGLSVDPLAPGWGTEVGYFLHTAYWGQGFATELVRAALHHGFDTLSLDLIGAFARPENAASTRVLEKCGLRRLGFVAELERDQYAITRAEWLRVLPR